MQTLQPVTTHIIKVYFPQPTKTLVTLSGQSSSFKMKKPFSTTVQVSFTRSEDVRVTHMLYADDLTLLANTADAMQTMLYRLVVYARSKHLTINTAKSEVVHFNSKRGAQVPTFM